MACFQGVDYDQPCDATGGGESAEFWAAGVGEGRGMQVVAGFPAGTFRWAEPRFTRRYTISNMFEFTDSTGLAAGAVALFGIGGALLLARRGARDEVYLQLTPGALPATDGQAAVGRRRGRVPVAVQFTPPEGARPGELGTLLDATADTRDIAATILDLAVRGHLRIEATGEEWAFQRGAGTDELAGYEAELLDRMFHWSNRVDTAELQTKDYAKLLPSTRRALYRRVVNELRWYHRNPEAIRRTASAIGAVLMVGGSIAALLLGALYGWGLLGLAIAAVGLCVALLRNRFGSRTALGSAMLAQARGFELYLTTAEADQIKFEEGIDVFSKYLPYAVIFGVAQRWTAIFTELADRGSYQFADTWSAGLWWGQGAGFAQQDLAASIDSLSSSVSASIQAATSASSGGSGFGGGSGGGGGGGFGGGGGGSW